MEDSDSFESDSSQELEVASQDKKKWYGTMVNCFANVIKMLGGPSFSVETALPWVIPYDAIQDLHYLGAGAQGKVFSGLLHGEMVAVKKVRQKSETNIKHLRKLNHENIVRFHGVCIESPDYSIIMEYCQYGSLFDFLHSGSNLLPSQLMMWAKEIALGMAYLHAHKIIHRDLKSPNVLISDNLTVKVSDFGTSREWENVSTIMSFTGTVAWMAPEMIRHEPCSDRVDVWSFGVVLFEIMTREIPYKILEALTILWGVGTDLLSLPIPTGLPNSIQVLMSQCWQRIPKNRPPFKTIAAHLEAASADIGNIDTETFAASQHAWAAEVRDTMNNIFARNNNSGHSCSSSNADGNEAGAVVPASAPAPAPAPIPVPATRDEVRRSEEHYDQRMMRANDMFLEVCTLQLQLEQRERDVEEREKLLKTCRCGLRRPYKVQRTSSTSSEGKPVLARGWRSADRRPRPVEKHPTKKRADPQLLVKYIDKDEGLTYTVAVEECACNDDTIRNNNCATTDTQAEQNGNGEILIVPVQKQKHLIDNAVIPDVAQV